jgi:NADPH:quinone reductase-like Zn-dependent oxidoreductase
MKAAAFVTPGGPDVLQLMDVETPQAGPGQVRVRVRAAGVQPYDIAIREGWNPKGAPEGYPRIPGNEFAGIVDQIGEGVSDVEIGAEVLAFTQLTAYAQYAVVPATQIAAKPKNMPWKVAGCFPAAIMTPHIALQELGVGQGDTVLIHAAAGGVGHTAVQLAQYWGATVIGTASQGNHDFLRSLGAIPVTYGDGLVERVRAVAPQGVDAALDGAGGDALTASLELVKDRDRIITLVEHGKAAELGVRLTPFKRNAARLAEAASLYEQGRLHVEVREAFPLARAADAHRRVATGHGRGKVVLLID